MIRKGRGDERGEKIHVGRGVKGDLKLDAWVGDEIMTFLCDGVRDGV